MKKLIFLFLFSILFQGCFSYKTVDYNNIASEKNQKFEVAKIDRTNVKGRLVSINENTMILKKTNPREAIITSYKRPLYNNIVIYKGCRLIRFR